MKSFTITSTLVSGVLSPLAPWTPGYISRSNQGRPTCNAQIPCCLCCDSRTRPTWRGPGGTATCVHSKTIRCWTNASSAKCRAFCTVLTSLNPSIPAWRLAWCDRSVPKGLIARTRFFSRPEQSHLPLLLHVVTSET